MGEKYIAGIDYIGITTPFYCNDGNGNFLFHKRSQNCRDEQGKWDPGGGQLEFGQSLDDSVLREVGEEYGCKGQIQEQLPAHSVIRNIKDDITHWVAIPFFILVNPSEVINNEGEKIDEIGWFTLDNLPQPLHEGFSQTYSLLRAYFAKYNSSKDNS